MEKWTPTWITLQMRKYASINDMEGIRLLMMHENYRPEYGIEAVGISFSRRHLDVAYEILSFKNTFEIYKAKSSPFAVLDKVEDALNEYKQRRMD